MTEHELSFADLLWFLQELGVESVSEWWDPHGKSFAIQYYVKRYGSRRHNEDS